MNVKNLHKAQFKAKVYELLACPGILNEQECVDILADVIQECSEGELDA